MELRVPCARLEVRRRSYRRGVWYQPAALWIPQNSTCGSKKLAGVVPALCALDSKERNIRIQKACGCQDPKKLHVLWIPKNEKALKFAGALLAGCVKPAQGRRASRVAHGLSQQVTTEPRTAAQQPTTYSESATDSAPPRRLNHRAPMRAHIRNNSSHTRESQRATLLLPNCPGIPFWEPHCK